MSEPTIEQILIWVSGLEHWNPDTLNDNKVMLRAIRAILEQHKDKDVPYRERNKLVAYLAKTYPSHLKLHPAEDAAWESDWRNIACIHSPAGQMSWHIHDSEVDQFAFLDRWQCKWDGHTTDEKYQRLAALNATSWELEAIRAFVERVADRMDDDPFINAKIHLSDELAAMEGRDEE